MENRFGRLLFLCQNLAVNVTYESGSSWTLRSVVDRNILKVARGRKFSTLNERATPQLT